MFEYFILEKPQTVMYNFKMLKICTLKTMSLNNALKLIIKSANIK